MATMDQSSHHQAHVVTSAHDPAVWWGEADYELRERAYAPIHKRLIDRLDPRPGERVLDVACGPGAIAARAARTGAEVTAIDLAPGMIARASRRPEPVNWLIGDCQSLPFDDDSFDVVVSSFGVIFAPDPQRAAAELSRVCRGRLAITAWIADPGRDLWQGCAPTCTASRLWSSETSAARLLPSFDLETEEGVLVAARTQRRGDLVLGPAHLPARSRAPAAAIGRAGPRGPRRLDPPLRKLPHQRHHPRPTACTCSAPATTTLTGCRLQSAAQPARRRRF